jgi:hypothetical protein
MKLLWLLNHGFLFQLVNWMIGQTNRLHGKNLVELGEFGFFQCKTIEPQTIKIQSLWSIVGNSS